VGVQEAKLPEVDEFLHVKGVAFFNQDNERLKKNMKTNFKLGVEARPPLVQIELLIQNM
jgi:hypothetical protein